MMMKFAKLAAAVACAATLAGCPTGTVPGMTGTPSGGGTPGPTGYKTADPAIAATCAQANPAAATSTASSKHGRYNGVTMPNAWDNLETEAKVTESIEANMSKPEFNCYHKFYADMLNKYYEIKMIRP
jgi:hypothetical protein